MSKLAFVKCEKPILPQEDEEIIRVLSVKRNKTDLMAKFITEKENYNLKIGFYAFTGKHPDKKLESNELIENSHLKAVVYCMRDLAIRARIELVKTIIILNHFQPEFQFFDIENNKLWDKYIILPRDCYNNHRLGLKFIDDNKVKTLDDYVQKKFQSLKQDEFTDIFITEIQNERTRFNMDEDEPRSSHKFNLHRPTISDAFDDYDQYSSWVNSR